VNRQLRCLSTAAILLLFAAAPAAAQWTRVTALPATRMSSVWANGDTILVGSDSLVFVSTNAGTSWHPSTKVVPGVTSVQAVRLRNGRLYAGTFGQGVFVSDNLGTTWQGFSQGLVGGPFETQLDISGLEIRGDSIYASTLGAAEKMQLALKLSLDLANALALGAWFAHTPELRQRLKVVTEIVVGSGSSLDDALLSPAADGAFAKTEELFDFADGVACLDALIVRFRGNT